MVWRISDINDVTEYKLHLCESKEGDRFYRLTAVESHLANDQLDDVVFTTIKVSNDLLRRRSLLKISELFLLENGQPFFVDAHGMWLTESEVKEMDADVDFNDIHWATGRMPNFAPK